jgi:hypothetical protein
MLSSILHGCHFDTISSFSTKNFVPDIFDQTSYIMQKVHKRGEILTSKYGMKTLQSGWHKKHSPMIGLQIINDDLSTADVI